MRAAFDAWGWISPVLVVPAATLAWIAHADGGAKLALLAVGVPVAYAYIVPGIGTNVLRMWEFDVRRRIGRFRPQHGFLFGGATALLALLAFGAPDRTPLATALMTSALLLCVNWIYDALAIRAGLLKVYNEPWSRGEPPWRIAADYVVWFFGLYGFVHGFALKAFALRLSVGVGWGGALATAATLLAVECAVPTLAYVAASRLLRGHWGCRPFEEKTS